MAETPLDDPRGDAYPDLIIDPQEEDFEAAVLRCDQHSELVWRERVIDVLRKMFSVGLADHAIDQGPRLFTFIAKGFSIRVSTQHQITALHAISLTLERYRDNIAERKLVIDNSDAPIDIRKACLNKNEFEVQLLKCEQYPEAVWKAQIADVIHKMKALDLADHAIDQAVCMFTLVRKGYDTSAAPQHQIAALNAAAQTLAKYRKKVEDGEHSLLIKRTVKKKQSGE